jgi:hypothetical protein
MEQQLGKYTHLASNQMHHSRNRLITSTPLLTPNNLIQQRNRLKLQLNSNRILRNGNSQEFRLIASRGMDSELG